MVVLSYVLMTVLMILGLFLIGLILLQRGRGGGLAGAFGGMGGQSAFGTKAGDVFTRITIGVATAWILLCAINVVVLHNSAGNLATFTSPEEADKADAVDTKKAKPKDGGFDEQVLPPPGEGDATKPGAVEGDKPAGEKPEEKKASDEKPADVKPEEAAKPPEKPAEPQGEKKPAEPEADKKPAEKVEEKPAEPKAEQPKAAEEAKPDEPKKSEEPKP